MFPLKFPFKIFIFCENISDALINRFVIFLADGTFSHIKVPADRTHRCVAKMKEIEENEREKTQYTTDVVAKIATITSSRFLFLQEFNSVRLKLDLWMFNMSRKINIPGKSLS